MRTISKAMGPLFLALFLVASPAEAKRVTRAIDVCYTMFAVAGSPVLMAVDGHWDSLLLEGGLGAFALGSALGDVRPGSPDRRIPALRYLVFPAAALHVAYPIWSLIQGNAEKDSGRIARSLPVAGAMVVGLVDIFYFKGKTWHPDDMHSLKLVPWPGPETGMTLTMDF